MDRDDEGDDETDTEDETEGADNDGEDGGEGSSGGCGQVAAMVAEVVSCKSPVDIVMPWPIQTTAQGISRTSMEQAKIKGRRKGLQRRFALLTMCFVRTRMCQKSLHAIAPLIRNRTNGPDASTATAEYRDGTAWRSRVDLLSCSSSSYASRHNRGVAMLICTTFCNEMTKDNVRGTIALVPRKHSQRGFTDIGTTVALVETSPAFSWRNSAENEGVSSRGIISHWPAWGRQKKSHGNKDEYRNTPEK